MAMVLPTLLLLSCTLLPVQGSVRFGLFVCSGRTYCHGRRNGHYTHTIPLARSQGLLSRSRRKGHSLDPRTLTLSSRRSGSGSGGIVFSGHPSGGTTLSGTLFSGLMIGSPPTRLGGSVTTSRAQKLGNESSAMRPVSVGSGVSEGWQRNGSIVIDDTSPWRMTPLLPSPPPPPSPFGIVAAADAVVGASPSTTTKLLRGTSFQLFMERQRGSDEITTLVRGSECRKKGCSRGRRGEEVGLGSIQIKSRVQLHKWPGQQPAVCTDGAICSCFVACTRNSLQ